MLVAIVILGLTLGALYQASSGATRNAGLARDYAKATALAESLLDEYSVLVAVPFSQQGAWENFAWQVQGVALPMPGLEAPANVGAFDDTVAQGTIGPAGGFLQDPIELAQIEARVALGDSNRTVVLTTVVPVQAQETAPNGL
jgi:type II secretory pathway pseudopilin PulG